MALSEKPKKIKIVDIQIEAYSAPAELTATQKEVWDELIKRMGNDYFPYEVHDLLAAYCRHITSGHYLSTLVDRVESETHFDILDPISLKTYNDVLVKRDKEYRAASSLATRLRLTTQTTVRADAVKKPSGVTPWQE